MLAEGLTYPKALELIAELEDKGIEANITIGAVRVNPLESEREFAKAICEDFGAFVSDADISENAGFLLLAHAEKSGKKIETKARGGPST